VSEDLLPRIASSVVLIAIAVAAAWAGGIVATLTVAAVAAIVHIEWGGITEGAPQPALPFTVAVALAVLLAGFGLVIAGALVAVLAALAALATGPTPWRAAGVLYAAAPGLALLLLRASPNLGLAAIVLLVTVVAATDIGAFAAGRAIGGPKLWPAVSPKKTWAGALGGLASGTVGGVAAAAVFGLGLGIALLVVAAILSISSQCGDLFESHVKRRFGVKDSGRIVPGHGGLMDRVDGLSCASLVALAVGFGHGGWDRLAEGLVVW
jgi:phosphatidate cytidylyltransferase